jgi:hypothetical protein
LFAEIREARGEGCVREVEVVRGGVVDLGEVREENR